MLHATAPDPTVVGRPTRRVRRLVALACTALLAPLVAVTVAVSAPAEAATPVSGVDVSGWDHPNGVPIDWAKVRASGRSFAIIKATESTTFTNKYFVTDYKQARANGLVVGAYHFARPKLPISSAADQAKFYVSTVQKAGSFRWSNTFAPVLDLEVTGGLSRTDLIAWTQRWLDTAKALTGRTPILYTYDSFVRSTLGNTTRFSTYPLWYARYTSITPTTSMLPGGWQQWTMWQYTSTGATPGIPDTGDVNLFNGTISALRAFADGRSSGIGPPAAVVDPQAAPAPGQATLAWSAPLDNGGSPVNRYRVSIDGRPEAFTPTRAFVATGLSAGEHQATISAENLAGVGPPTTVTFTIAPFEAADVPAPVAPTLSVAVPRTGSAYTSNLVRVALTRPGTGQSVAGASVSIVVTPEYQAPQATIRVTTGDDGTALTTFKAPIDAVVTARSTSLPGYSGGYARTGIRISPTSSAFLSTTSVKRTGRVTMTGGTTPVIAGEKAYRQILTSRGWRTVASTTITSGGRYSFPVPTTTKGVKKLRILIPETRRHLAVTSRVVVLTVR